MSSKERPAGMGPGARYSGLASAAPEDLGDEGEEEAARHDAGDAVGYGLAPEGLLRAEGGGEDEYGGEEDALAQQGADEREMHAAEGRRLVHERILDGERDYHRGEDLDEADAAPRGLRACILQPTVLRPSIQPTIHAGIIIYDKATAGLLHH